MPNLIVLGFDWGAKRIGVAVGNGLLQQASPLKTLAAKEGQPDWHLVKKLIQEWRPRALLVGLPLDIEGKELYTTQKAKNFQKQLQTKFELPVYLVDERLTTVEARQQLFDEGGYRRIQSAEVDSYAAKLIVEQWLIEQSA
jgi:putative Holliday junction resolvase